MERIKLFKTQGVCMYPLIKENSIICVKNDSIAHLKEGSIVVVNTGEKVVGHIFMGVGVTKNHKYLITSSLKSARLDKLYSIEKLEGTILKSYDTKLQIRNIKIIIPPFILLLVRNLMSLSYFFCSIVYNSLRFNAGKVYNIFKIIVEECEKWRLVWLYFYLRRI